MPEAFVEDPAAARLLYPFGVAEQPEVVPQLIAFPLKLKSAELKFTAFAGAGAQT